MTDKQPIETVPKGVLVEFIGPMERIPYEDVESFDMIVGGGIVYGKDVAENYRYAVRINATHWRPV